MAEEAFYATDLYMHSKTTIDNVYNGRSDMGTIIADPTNYHDPTLVTLRRIVHYCMARICLYYMDFIEDGSKYMLEQVVWTGAWPNTMRLDPTDVFFACFLWIETGRMAVYKIRRGYPIPEAGPDEAGKQILCMGWRLTQSTRTLNTNIDVTEYGTQDRGILLPIRLI